MATSIFVNLPVKNLARSVEFFTRLGYTFNPQFTDDNATCMIVSETIFVMLLVEPFFKTFTDKPIVDASRGTEVIIALSQPSKDDVKRIAETAAAAGAGKHKDAVDNGFMYHCSFTDPDGHVWEHLWMDPAHVQG